MSINPHAPAPARIVLLPRVQRVGTLPALMVIVVVAGGIAHLAAAFARLSPRYLPDEYLYSQLARSLGRGEGIRVLGQPSPFPALLEPILTAAFWLPGNAELAYRLTQSFHAVAMSAAALPIWYLARRLGLSLRATIVVVALSAVAPGFVYVGYVTADALGYLLALTAVALGVRALESRSTWSQLLFLAVTAAAVSARAQYVVLAPAFLIAALVVQRGRILQVGRRLPVIAVALAVAGVATVATGSSMLGRYQAVMSFGLSWETLKWVAVSIPLLAVGTGVVVLPGAVAWLGSTLAKPRDDVLTAFAAFVAAFALGLVVATAVVSVDTGSRRFFERYLIVLMPLLGLAFLCWLDDRAKGRWTAVAIGAAIVVLAAVVPLSGYAEGQGRADSPTLLAVSWLSEPLGVGSASLAAALAITAAALIGVVAAWTTRIPRFAVVATAFVFLAALSVGAHAADIVGSQRFEERNFAGSPRWVDAAGAREVVLIQTANSGTPEAMITSFWNTSVTEITRLGDVHIDPVDGMGSLLSVRSDGLLVTADGSPLQRPTLFASSGTSAAFSSTVRVIPERTFALILPDRPIRLVGLAEGVRSDGTLAPAGRFAAYPVPGGLCSVTTVRLAVPRSAPTTTLTLREGGKAARSVVLRPGASRTITVRSASTHGRTIEYEGWVAGTRGARSLVTTIALARFAARTSTCGKG